MATRKKVDTAYQTPKGEEGYFHVEIEKVMFNSATGEKTSKPTIQKYDRRAWEISEPNMSRQGWTYKVLHDPTK